jgi:hypothetical protein
MVFRPIKLTKILLTKQFFRNPTMTQQTSNYELEFQPLVLRISNSLAKKLNEMAETENISKADIVRRALGFYALALEAENRGQITAFVNEQNEIFEMIKINNNQKHYFYYSKIHQAFSERLEQPDVLTNPANYLGPNWEDVLNFWIYLDTLSDQEKKKMNDLYWDLNDDARESAIIASRDAADDVVGEDFRYAAWFAACDVTGGWVVFGFATYELIGDVKNKVAYDLIMSHKKS